MHSCYLNPCYIYEVVSQSASHSQCSWMLKVYFFGYLLLSMWSNILKRLKRVLFMRNFFVCPGIKLNHLALKWLWLSWVHAVQKQWHSEKGGYRFHAPLSSPIYTALFFGVPFTPPQHLTYLIFFLITSCLTNTLAKVDPQDQSEYNRALKKDLSYPI